jgi:hypothetical protein
MPDDSGCQTNQIPDKPDTRQFWMPDKPDTPDARKFWIHQKIMDTPDQSIISPLLWHYYVML